jgi:plasmid stabilization system protein ParE
MAYDIRLTRSARADLREVMDFLEVYAPDVATKWYKGLMEALESLQDMPARHPLIHESSHIARSLRSLLYHSHRLIYEIDESRRLVHIVRIYHSARASLGHDDIDIEAAE